VAALPSLGRKERVVGVVQVGDLAGGHGLGDSSPGGLVLGHEPLALRAAIPVGGDGQPLGLLSADDATLRSSRSLFLLAGLGLVDADGGVGAPVGRAGGADLDALVEPRRAGELVVTERRAVSTR